MGIAAYNRGSQLVANHVAMDKQNYIFQMMEDINSLPKKFSTNEYRKPFGKVVICQDPYRNDWWVLDAIKKFDGFGYCYTTLREAVQQWDINLVSYNAISNEWIAL